MLSVSLNKTFPCSYRWPDEGADGVELFQAGQCGAAEAGVVGHPAVLHHVWGARRGGPSAGRAATAASPDLRRYAG